MLLLSLSTYIFRKEVTQGIQLAFRLKKIISMFPVVGLHPKTGMHDAVFIFNFIKRKTLMYNLLINITGRQTII